MASKKKRNFDNRSWCFLEPDLIQSDAFRDLSGKWALVVLIRFLQKAHRRRPGRRRVSLHKYEITNNGEIVFTYSEARELGIKYDKTFGRILHELVTDKGFIDITEPGNWYEKKTNEVRLEL